MVENRDEAIVYALEKVRWRALAQTGDTLDFSLAGELPFQTAYSARSAHETAGAGTGWPPSRVGAYRLPTDARRRNSGRSWQQLATGVALDPMGDTDKDFGRHEGWEAGGGEMPPFDIAVVCRNGHVVNDRQQMAPEQNSPYCAECGQPTLDRCESCEKRIRGYDGRYRLRMRRPPNYCDDCGKPYPWTAAALAAAAEIAETLAPAEREVLNANLPDILSETARTGVAAGKLKGLLSKMSGWGADALKQIVVTVGVEVAKRQMGLIP